MINSLYDANGNLKQVDNSLTTVSNVYTYDALNRLDTASGSFGSQDFGYDKNGNRLQLIEDGNILSYTYEANSNRLDIAANDDVVTDANGNITTQGAWTYTHTAHNRLATASQKKLAGTYGYNGLGQRISKIANRVTQSYVYGLSGELLQESDGTASVEYIYLNGQPLALIQQGNVYYIHNDHLGTPRAVTDATKSVVWSWDSDAFGTTEPVGVTTGKGKNAYTFTLNLRFPGQYYDSESGLHYNYFRYYDPRTGRYITSDPIGLAGGLNTYGYVGGNPVYWIDPLGLDAKSDGGYTIPTFIPIPPSKTESGWDIEYTWDLPFEVPRLCLKGVCVPNPMMNEDADAEREKSKAKGVPECEIGPSGKPKIHVKKHSSRKKAKDSASQEGSGPPMHHPSPTRGGPHYHPTDANGNKIPGPHHEYPR